ncbi:hypothetical protein CDD80_3512 [Ophiocordyceps camponoti-rufipedis]|uniref:Uncharacterized protein n=1 Tax=Ophiocordyceps camponoti-rufipedis TaxID=2004952 RepID=A0A2C5Z2J2_9HYPO|nr:hypothetical protein CDD80_3512 [Ophiocordyceps camponoti-rufipedis]
MLLRLVPWESEQPQPLDANFGRVKSLSSSSRFAVATFLTGGNRESPEDHDLVSDDYFISTRILAYQLLHNPETRCNKSVDFVVLVTENVPELTRQQLRANGAIVVEAEPIPLSWWIKTGVTRWKDQFSKLRLFEMTQYERIIFLDADCLVRGKVDGLFDDVQVREAAPVLSTQQTRTDEAPLPAQYMFGARSDNHLTGARDHPFPPLNTNVFSAGFWVAAPSHELFSYFMSILKHYRRFDPHTMEQSMLNYAFRRGGPMPWREVHYRWSATWPNEQDAQGGVITLHEKFWSTGPRELRELWAQQRDAMEEYFGRGSS